MTDGAVRLDLAALAPDQRAAVVDIARRVQAAGGRALMVGGSVRDLLLGEARVKDVDLEVFGVAPEALCRTLGAAYAFDACGASFGVLKVKHLDIDVALPRREAKRGTGHRGFDVFADPAMSVRDAAARRDFTVNALYYDPLAERLEDPYGGRADLGARILRHVSARFAEDPLRVLRGMQFTARFDLDPAPETVAVCRTMTIEDLPPERLFEEWRKLLTKGTAIGKGLAFLRATGWTRYFPELAALIGCAQDPHWHPEGDVWNHTCLCLDAFARRRTGDPEEDLVVGLAVLCHDFGKPLTTKLDASGALRSFGHAEAGAPLAVNFLERMKAPKKLQETVSKLVEFHMATQNFPDGVSDRAVRRLAAKLAPANIVLWATLCKADALGCGKVVRKLNRNEEIRFRSEPWLEAARRLAVVNSAPQPLVQGRELIALGYRPSPFFGAILKEAFEAQLEGEFLSREGGVEWLKARLQESSEKNMRAS